MTFEEISTAPSRVASTNVGKLVDAKEFDKVLEDSRLDKLRVKRGHSVDLLNQLSSVDGTMARTLKEPTTAR